MADSDKVQEATLSNGDLKKSTSLKNPAEKSERKKSLKKALTEEEEEDVGTDEGDTGTPKSKKKKKQKTGKRKLRHCYSNKVQDYQVRIKVIEARQLQGANISPITKVECYNQVKQTRVKNSTNSPFWGDTFFFNFHASPSELFDELITFSVFNSRRLRNDAMIGAFKFDLGMIYEEENHCFLNKWLLLYDQDDPMAGAKGYLKFSAAILGPGDEAPSFTVTADLEDDDIESNLLRPAGVQLRPATFTLRVYRAEDLPRMDSDVWEGIKKVFSGDAKKELVDPYLVFQFAGKEIKTSVKYNSDHPEWNEELKIGLQFPSMCERIKLQLFDWDRMTDDEVIGTAIIDLSTVAAQGDNGFLPTFGPCFINLYGSPREFSNLPDKFDALNHGKGEGVAYRGRVMVELTTTLDQTPEAEEENTPVSQDNLLKLQKFQRRRKYRLHAAFLSASMVTAIDCPVEFEVSIGNYGNKLDENLQLSSSTTQPTNAIFDGTFYHFLPWGSSKPCVVVDCHWEDVSSRLFNVNFFLRVMDTLATNMDRIRVALKANLPAEEQANFVIKAFDDLILQCSKPLPDWEAGESPQNELDMKLSSLRSNEMAFLRKEALRVREESTSVEQALTDLEMLYGQLRNLASEPQNSMPDVVIWMITGEKRTVYYRIPAYDVLYSNNADYQGRFCGVIQTINLKFPCLKDTEIEHYAIPAQLRLKLWLGLEKDEPEWHKMQTEGELAVLAETYENQASLMGSWSTRGPMMSRAPWTDSSGRIEAKKDNLKPPNGWGWDGEWYVSPELSLFFDKDAGLTQYLEDVFVCQERVAGGQWTPAQVQFTDVKGDASQAPNDIPLPKGWAWEAEWEVDLNRPCDEDGWEYTVEASIGGYVPVEKLYHMCRRRRYVRPRKLLDESKTVEDVGEKKVADTEHWEYAPLFEMRFHAKERKTDLVRRRRWHRKMKPVNTGAPCLFNLTDKDTEKGTLVAPRMCLVFKNPQKWQLRAYIYQARNLLAGDQTGFSDPYARVAFLNQSQCSERIDKTICPTWDQTLIFHKVDIYGDAASVIESPPNVVIEVFDHDLLGEDEFLGRCQVTPIVKVKPDDPQKAVLQWYSIIKGNREGGELLAAFELYLITDNAPPYTPPKRGSLFSVPDGIRPVMQRTGIEILSWGVRNMSKYQLANVTSPSIEFEIGGHVMQTEVIKNTSVNPNFDNPVLFLDVLLPKEELYMPPLNIKVRDNRHFGRKPLVGMHVCKSVDEFRHSASADDCGADFPGTINISGFEWFGDEDGSTVRSTKGEDEVSVVEAEALKSPKLPKTPKKKGFKLFGGDKKPVKRKKDELDLHMMDEDIDWWSKYYASLGEWNKCNKYKEMNYDIMKIHKTELEKVEGYNEFTDFCKTFLLYCGKNLEDEDESSVGEFKGAFRIYPLPEDRACKLPTKFFERGLPSSQPVDCIVRVYIIKAIDLQPNDPSGLADPYVEVQLGKKIVSNKDSYLPNTLTPEFGRMFELKCTIPIQKDLQIRILDYDLMSTDDVIGETFIDLENRLLTRHRATCGLPQSYCTDGPNKWRDYLKPTEILEQFCVKNFAPEPIYSGENNEVVVIGQRRFKLEHFEKNVLQNPHFGIPKERLALHVLNSLPLVKEHVETRPLYSPLQPGIEQGKLQCWVDIFPTTLENAGEPFEITPRKPKGYQLRIIIWNTKDVILEDENLLGEKMSDIYVKGWLSGIEEKQETDVHYRSLDGEGNFNWRFVFPFQYLPAENVLVVKQKEHFWSLDETEQRIPCNVVLQIWDNDKFSADDFLGTLDLTLSKMPAPAKKSRQCDLNQVLSNPSQMKYINLFECRRAYGYWPCYNDETGVAELTGKIEMELELLSEEEALAKPAGMGRDEPNENPKLDPPNRPDTSFLWFTSPWKTFKFIIWKNFKWYFIGGIATVLAGLLIALFIYTIPGLMARKMFGI